MSNPKSPSPIIVTQIVGKGVLASGDWLLAIGERLKTDSRKQIPDLFTPATAHPDSPGTSPDQPVLAA